MSIELYHGNLGTVTTVSPKFSERRRIALLRNYAVRVVTNARQRAKLRCIPFDLDAAFVEQLMVDNHWRCAISGMELEPQKMPGGKREPFGPSLDRIVPERGYVRGNVRVVCDIINCAMNQWGLETLMSMIGKLERG